MSQLTTEQLHEHCQCGHDRARHYGHYAYIFGREPDASHPADEVCDRCLTCTAFRLAATYTANQRQAPRRPMPSDPIDEYQRCQCLCPRGEHDGLLMLGKCSSCSCQRFLRRDPEAEEAEIKLLNTTLEQTFDA